MRIFNHSVNSNLRNHQKNKVSKFATLLSTPLLIPHQQFGECYENNGVQEITELVSYENCLAKGKCVKCVKTLPNLSGFSSTNQGQKSIFGTLLPLEDPTDVKDAVLKEKIKKQYSSVVKIFCDARYPDSSQPWNLQPTKEGIATCFPIAGRRLITNAHCVEESIRLLVSKPGDPERYSAYLEAVNHEYDLALVKVDNEKFWEGLQELEFGDVPEMQEPVTVVGYPTGGEQLSVTKGVVNRVDISTTAYSYLKRPSIQIDAPINPGNSGGPAFRLSDGKVVGVVYLLDPDSRNIGCIIPPKTVKQFLTEVEKHKKNPEFVALNFESQKLVNPGMKRYFGVDKIKDTDLPKGVTKDGVLITQVNGPLNEEFKKEELAKLRRLKISDDEDIYGLKVNDVLLSLNGHDIGGDGTILLRGIERVGIEFAIDECITGGNVEALVLRKKKLMRILVPLRSPRQLFPIPKKNRPPRYFVYGGIVFNAEFENWHDNYDSNTLFKPPKNPGEEYIYVTEILPTELTVGYRTPRSRKESRICSVDGVKVTNFKQMIQLLGGNRDKPFVEIEFKNKNRIVLDRNKTRAITPEIFKQNRVSKPWSDCLKDECEKANLPK